ncbi:ATE1 [Candida oxycetoniae]|uniref:arginyltransferase n=1 Tax=Candida oxycetoniae TaxID=497107 RepID=A0AAI9SW13_9ASCO|nr:ATE1 [Candida oxycetoniae]KAI3403755.2 ATE1 [Candida oxycetoniae]
MKVTPPSYIPDGHCGYCKDSKLDHYALESESRRRAGFGGLVKESMTIGMSIWEMTCQEYDELINKGFRRSGTFLYKNDLLRSCCRLYTIRTNFLHFQISKKQRKIVNKFINAICPLASELSPLAKNTFDLGRLIEAILKSKDFYTKFEPSSFSREKFELYKRYQVRVHNDDPDDVDEESFIRFLCNTPFSGNEVQGKPQDWENLKIENWPKNKSAGTDYCRQSKRIGPTHECYYLHGKLIAISVLDFLPSGISSIYFIWDPDYAYLSLGTISGIKEIQMCNELEYDWYYLGYYVEDCPKMKYKDQFGGEILDLCTETYYPLAEVRKFIQNGRLFVIGEADRGNKGGGEGEKGGGEFFMPDNQYPNEGHVKDGFTNVAEKLYGSCDVEIIANKAGNELANKYSVSRTNQYNLPNVIPGVFPLPQILYWFQSGALDSDFETRLLIGGRSKKVKFSQLSDEGKGLIIDCIRLFGIERMKQVVLVF